MHLSDKWARYLVDQPETGMDYTVCSIVLHDGKKYDQALIVHCHILAQIRNYPEIPFVEADIAEIIVTHDKWKW